MILGRWLMHPFNNCVALVVTGMEIAPDLHLGGYKVLAVETGPTYRGERVGYAEPSKDDKAIAFTRHKFLAEIDTWTPGGGVRERLVDDDLTPRPGPPDARIVSRWMDSGLDHWLTLDVASSQAPKPGDVIGKYMIGAVCKSTFTDGHYDCYARPSKRDREIAWKRSPWPWIQIL